MSDPQKVQRRKMITYFFIAFAGWLMDGIGFSVPLGVDYLNSIFFTVGTLVALVFGALFLITLFK